jgi:Trk K+ transport system NAD-binding subunit
MSRNLIDDGVDHRIVERTPDRMHDRSRHVVGDATDPAVLGEAGLDRAASIAITTHNDDVNVYLTMYCRRLRPDVQILSRATLEHNVSTLRRAARTSCCRHPLEANAIFDVLRHGNLMLLAAGLQVFTVPAAGARGPIDCRIGIAGHRASQRDGDPAGGRPGRTP